MIDSEVKQQILADLPVQALLEGKYGGVEGGHGLLRLVLWRAGSAYGLGGFRMTAAMAAAGSCSHPCPMCR